MEPKFLRNLYSDIQVVEAYQSGNKSVQQFWYEKCRAQFAKGTSNYSGLPYYDLDDLFQDSFIILWEKMESRQLGVYDGMVFVQAKNGVEIVYDLLGYFMRIVKNKYFEMLRSGKYVVAFNEVMVSDREIFDVLYWNEDVEVEKDRIVSKCLLALPKSCLEILTMFYYEKMSLTRILEVRPNNNSYEGLKSRKSKCISNLKKRIKESFEKAGL